MNQSYKCQTCKWQFSAPQRDTCALCGSPDITEIPPLALPPQPAAVPQPVTYAAPDEQQGQH